MNTPFLGEGKSITHALELVNINLHTNFDRSSFTHSKDI